MAVYIWTNKGDIASNNLPNDTATNFGSGGATFPEEGNLLRFVSAGVSPGSINNVNVLAAYTLPANSFDISGRGINILAQGSVTNTVNSKTMYIYYGCTSAVVGSTVSGGTVIATVGPYSTATAGGWALEANVFKYGVSGSNTQEGLHMSGQIAATLTALTAPSALTAAENAPIIIAVCGNAVTATSDIVLNFFEINAMN